jgi:hypothetical protein
MTRVRYVCYVYGGSRFVGTAVQCSSGRLCGMFTFTSNVSILVWTTVQMSCCSLHI